MGHTAIKCLLILLIAFCYQRCAPTKQPADIKGIWYTYYNSIYLEIIIWPEKIYSMGGKAGNNLWVSDGLFYYSPQDLLESALLKCELRNDTLLFADGEVIHRATLQAGEIHLTVDTVELQLKKVFEQDHIMSQLLKIDTLSWDNANFIKYLQGYYQRRDSVKGRKV